MAAVPNPNGDIAVANPPTDGISALAWSPVGNTLAAASWDNTVRVYDIAQNLQAQPKTMITHTAPVLCTGFTADGQYVLSAGCDKIAKMHSLATGQEQQIGVHQAPIKEISWVDGFNLVVTGSWDRTLKYWDCRQGTPTLSVQLPERVYSMDVKAPLLVAACAERKIVVYDLRQPQNEFKRIDSPLKYQSRCVACFPDQTGFALGSIEGRVAVHHVLDKDATRNFAFKCHRDSNQIYAVNQIAFHPLHHTFATVGSDGGFNFWDKENKQRLKPFNRCNTTLSAAAFNGNGQIFAYAASYDWSKGAEHHNPQTATNNIFLHMTPDNEIMPKKKKGR